MPDYSQFKPALEAAKQAADLQKAAQQVPDYLRRASVPRAPDGVAQAQQLMDAARPLRDALTFLGRT